ncbi:MAG: hypothetical protein J6V17_03010 [Bacteroidales bacterium]|nr:hypothetical protein [Bacteroidales bacterium]
MKIKHILLLASAAVIGMTGCQKGKMEQAEEGRNTHRLVISAYADTETKTSVTAVSGGYQVSWNVGDQILLHECAPEAGEDDYDAVSTFESQKLAADDLFENMASFAFEDIEDRTASEFSYIATYGPWSNAEYSDWSTYDYIYEEWASTFDYTGERLDPHMVIQMSFPREQTPLADSFDPYADLMVSDMKVLREQMTGEASFRFARLGTIVKMTLTGLEDYKDYNVNDMVLTIGESFKANGTIKYDPILNKYVLLNEEEEVRSGGGMPSEILIYGDNIQIGDDGKADVWLRLPSGVLSDWFRVEVNLSKDEEDDIALARFVDMTDRSRLLIFKEGGLTTFSVGEFAVADVEPVGDIRWTITDAMDGFTATWDDVDHASGYESYISPWSSDEIIPLTPADEGDGTWSVSIERGMEKGNYTIYVKPIPEDGHALTYHDYSTEEIPIGVPSVYWFSHTTFSDDSENIEDTDESIIPVYSPGKVRFQNLKKVYDSSWTALEATGDWFMYSTEPLTMHSIELWTKDDSRSCFKVYASSTPGAESFELSGSVIDTSVIDAGSGSYRYNHTHYLYRFTFPESGDYKYYTIKGTRPDTDPAVVMTSQYTYVYRYIMSSEE